MATLGIVVPSFVVIYLISMFLDNFLELTIIANAFKGIKIAVGILILDAAVTMIKKMHKETAKSDYALLLRGHAVYQYFRMELFFYQLNADCSSCQSDDFYSEWRT